MFSSGTNEKPGTSGSNFFRSFNVALSAPRVRPWKPRIEQTKLVRPVACRANFSAASVLSVPELQRKTRSSPGGVMATSFSISRARTSL